MAPATEFNKTVHASLVTDQFIASDSVEYSGDSGPRQRKNSALRLVSLAPFERHAQILPAILRDSSVNFLLALKKKS